MRPDKPSTKIMCITSSTHQKVVFSTTIFTVPGYLARFVKVSSSSIAASGGSSSIAASSDTSSSAHSSNSQGGEDAEDLNIPAAAAWVSVGDDRAAERLPGDLDERATRTAEGVDIECDRVGGNQVSACLAFLTLQHSQLLLDTNIYLLYLTNPSAHYYSIQSKARG